MNGGEVTIISPESPSPGISPEIPSPGITTLDATVSRIELEELKRIQSEKSSGLEVEQPERMQSKIPFGTNINTNANTNTLESNPKPLDLWWVVPPRPSDSEELKLWEKDLVVRKVWAARMEVPYWNWNELHLSLGPKSITESKSIIEDVSIDSDSNVKMETSEGFEVLEVGDLESLFMENIESDNNIDGFEEGDLESLFNEDIPESYIIQSNVLGLLPKNVVDLKSLCSKISSIIRKDVINSNNEDREVDVMLLEVINVVNSILFEMNSVVHKGYVNSFDLFDDKKYPNLAQVIKGLTTDVKSNNKGINKYDSLSSKDKILLSNWGYQLLLLE